MAYPARGGRRPQEFASKVSHRHVVNDEFVQEFLDDCNLPARAAEVADADIDPVRVERPSVNPIDFVVSVDSGYRTVAVREEFPSATIAFFQFGALFFRIDDLRELADEPFIAPEDMARLKNIQRLKMVLPVKNVTHSDCGTLTRSVRTAVYEFMKRSTEDEPLLETLKWLIYREFGRSRDTWSLASCPECGARSVNLRVHDLSGEYTWRCPSCGGTIFLSDVLRLHEAVDDELGAGGVLGYVATAIEQLVMTHLMRIMLNMAPHLLGRTLFVKDGPLAFFGQTANLQGPMRELVGHILERKELYMVGLEKSGSFVEHADEIADLLSPGDIQILNDTYIYRYVVPGKRNEDKPYGHNTYYGHKLIYKSEQGGMHVATVPTSQARSSPKLSQLPNVPVVLENLDLLRCDMYDSALVPVSLVNKLISLAEHPSSRLLEKFAKGRVSEER